MNFECSEKPALLHVPAIAIKRDRTSENSDVICAREEGLIMAHEFDSQGKGENTTSNDMF